MLGIPPSEIQPRVGIGFFHRHAVEDYSYGCFREALWATFGGHGEKIERGTDSGF